MENPLQKKSFLVPISACWKNVMKIKLAFSNLWYIEALGTFDQRN